MNHDDALVGFHAQELRDLRRDVSRLVEKVSGVTTDVDTINSDLYNHGRDGLKTQFTMFVADYRAREDERAKVERRRWRVAGFVLALLTLAVTSLGVVVTLRAAHEGVMYLPRLPHAVGAPIYAVNKTSAQTAGLN